MTARGTQWQAGRPWRSFLWAMLLVPLVAPQTALAAEMKTVELNGQTFTLPADFDIELVAGPPLVERPITADFDEQGRLYVSDSSGSNDKVDQQLADKPHRILRLEDSDGDGRFDQQVVFADRMMFPEGTLWYDGSLYVSAPPSIWKLTDTDGDGIADLREEWFQAGTLTGCANDLHGPYLGRDGWIYWCKGAFAQQIYDRPGRAAFVTRAAHIFRCRPDAPRDPRTGSVLTTAIEPVMTGGMDNPVDVAFTLTGERILTTTFLVNPGGGQRDGLIHAIYGGVYGKPHGVLEGHARTGELMPPLVHLGAAAPAGLHCFDSARWGTEFQGNLFACCFNMHKVTRHVLSESGASYTASTEDFLDSSNVDFHPTDVLEDADGSLLIVDTGGWYKLCCPTSQLWKPDVLGGIYRVRHRDATSKTGVWEDPRGRALSWEKMPPVELTGLLSDERPAVREQAIQRLAKLKESVVEPLTSALHHSPDSNARQHALWALTRIAAPAARAAVRGFLSDPDSAVRRVALQSVSLWRDRQALHQLHSLLGSDSFESRLAAEALGRIGDASSIGPLCASSSSAHSREMQHALAYALIEIGDAAAVRTRWESNPTGRPIAALALEMLDPHSLPAVEIVDWLEDADSQRQQVAEWLLGRHPEWGAVFADRLRKGLQAPLNSAEAEELTAWLQMFSTQPDIHHMIGETLADPKAPVASRIVALTVIQRTAGGKLSSDWATALAAALTDEDPELVSHAVVTVRALSASQCDTSACNTSLREIVSSSRFDEETRLDALATLSRSDSPLAPDLFQLAIQRLSGDHSLRSRAAAVRTLVTSAITGEQWPLLAEAFRTIGPLEAPRLLESFARTTDDAVGHKLTSELKASPALASLRVDLLRKVLAGYSADVQAEGEALARLINTDLERQQSQLEAMLEKVPEGDLRRGFAVFRSSKAACTTCHQLGYVGGNAGPDLSKIGKIRTERDLLEAILFPSASFVRSYEPVVVVRTDGRIENGIVRDESSTELLLIKNATETARIPRHEIEELRPSGVSVMPAGFGQQLSTQDLIDLVVFLKSLQ